MNRTPYTKNYFSSKGRANRAEYIILFILHSILFILGERLPTWLSSFVSSNIYILIMQYILGCLFIITSFVGNVLATTRRLHDLNISGWWQLITIALYIIELPNYISILIIIPLIFCKGAEGVNKYGQQSTLFLFFKINRIIDRITFFRTWMGVEKKPDGKLFYLERGSFLLFFNQKLTIHKINSNTYNKLRIFALIELLVIIVLGVHIKSSTSNYDIIDLLIIFMLIALYDVVSIFLRIKLIKNQKISLNRMLK